MYKHPLEYALIAPVDFSEKGHSIDRLEGLMRYEPNKSLPDGYKQVTHLYGYCVYNGNGRLHEKFRALKRYYESVQIKA